MCCISICSPLRTDTLCGTARIVSVRFCAVTTTSPRVASVDARRLSELSAAMAAAGRMETAVQMKAAVQTSGGRQWDRRTGTGILWGAMDFGAFEPRGLAAAQASLNEQTQLRRNES